MVRLRTWRDYTAGSGGGKIEEKDNAQAQRKKEEADPSLRSG
jgi:hypothetical protein